MSGTAALDVDPSDDRLARAQARFQWPLLAAALLSIPAIIIETTKSGGSLEGAAQVMDWVIWVAFASEMAVLLYLAPDRWAWVRRHPFDVAIVLLTPPFLPPALQTLRVFRLLRILRLVRLVALAREVFSLSGVKYASLFLVVIVLAGGVAFADAERAHHLSDWDGIWWAITTVTTVGYGEPEVTTTASRIIAIVIMVAGIGFVSLLTGALAQRFSLRMAHVREVDTQILDELREIRERLDRLEVTEGRRNA